MVAALALVLLLLITLAACAGVVVLGHELTRRRRAEHDWLAGEFADLDNRLVWCEGELADNAGYLDGLHERVGALEQRGYRAGS